MLKLISINFYFCFFVEFLWFYFLCIRLLAILVVVVVVFFYVWYNIGVQFYYFECVYPVFYPFPSCVLVPVEDDLIMYMWIYFWIFYSVSWCSEVSLCWFNYCRFVINFKIRKHVPLLFLKIALLIGVFHGSKLI